MIFGTLAVLVFAVIYWKVLPAGFRPPALLIFGVILFSMMAWSIAANLAVVLLVILALAVAPRPLGTRIAIVLALVALILNKYASLPVFQVVGLSYVTFRLISLARTVAREKREPPSPSKTLLYALFPPTFLAGPIEPFERFERVIVPATLSRSDLFESLLRIAIGLGKKLLLVEPLRVLADENFTLSASGPTLWLGLLAYSLFLYLDFSAYSDLAIGGARLFGYPIGENFNWPYLADSISDFWNRWHISLSHFLRDHVFMPLSGRAVEIFGPRPLLAGSLASIITMTFCGMWHGDRGSFVVWGFGHGLLLATHQWYRQTALGRLPARRRMKLQGHPVYRTIGMALTFLCVCLLWVPFRFTLDESALVYGRLFSVFFQSAM